MKWVRIIAFVVLVILAARSVRAQSLNTYTNPPPGQPNFPHVGIYNPPAPVISGSGSTGGSTVYNYAVVAYGHDVSGNLIPTLMGAVAQTTTGQSVLGIGTPIFLTTQNDAGAFQYDFLKLIGGVWKQIPGCAAVLAGNFFGNGTICEDIGTAPTTYNLPQTNATVDLVAVNLSAGTIANLSGATSVQAYNAVCASPGGTDDATAIGAAFTASRNATVYFPPCGIGTCYNVASAVVWNLATNPNPGPMRIFGDGPNSEICVNNATGGLQIVDTAGVSSTHHLMVDHLRIVPVYSVSSPGYGLDLKLVAIANVSEVIIDGTGATNAFTVGLQCDGCQQNRFSGVRLLGHSTGFLAQDNSGIGSNQNTFINFYASVNGNGVDLEGSAASNSFFGLSVQANTATGFLQNQTGSAGGFGPNAIYGSEFEANTVNDIYDKAGNLQVYNSLLTGSTGNPTFAFRADTAAFFKLEGSIINEPMEIFGINAGQRDWIEDNIVNATYTNVAGLDQVITLNNRGNFAPPNTLFSGKSTFAAAPTCDAGTQGMKWLFASDVTTCAFDTTITGSGSLICPATCNGSVWVGG